MEIGALHGAGYTLSATEEKRKHAYLGSLDVFWMMYKKSLEDPDAFWKEAVVPFFWKKPVPEKNIDVRKGDVFIEWLKGVSTNICYNALDKHVEDGFEEQIAYFWEEYDLQDIDKIIYKELLRSLLFRKCS
ncbi:Acetyl-coenzyme A synthetase, cytoplasmic [Araneus ventricosus]|uniref:Acetyl-coenzyme A synthetase, cytoplasmic n=1 Tax=Araneus ventricosus TaxID=182803 RepID=A0A4Y2EJZ3_ARAVE|nr:Acetyl-coenzyme A synthetase, cytoplasmic [Araneus ventricosus]